METLIDKRPTHEIVASLGTTNTLLRKGIKGVVEEREDDTYKYVFYPVGDDQYTTRLVDALGVDGDGSPCGVIMRKHELRKIK